jgi:predicted DNA-binding transcriptional regulator AlpA
MSEGNRHGRKQNWEKRKSSEFLTSFQVADLIGVSPWTLLYWRRRHQGPPFVKMASHTLRYPRTELETWLESLRRNGQ